MPLSFASSPSFIMQSLNEAIVGQGTIIILIFVLIFHNYTHDTLVLFRNFTTYITNPFTTTKADTRMCEFIKPKKLTFENEIGLSSKPQIKPLLSREVKQPENLNFDKLKNEFSKLYVLPVQIKTEYQNSEKVKTDLVSDEEVAAELGPDYDPPCFQRTYEAGIRNAKERILERRKKESIQGIIQKAFKSMD